MLRWWGKQALLDIVGRIFLYFTTNAQGDKLAVPFQITQVRNLWPSNFTSLYSSNRYTCTCACAYFIANSIYIRTEWLTKAWCILTMGRHVIVKADEKKMYVPYLYEIQSSRYVFILKTTESRVNSQKPNSTYDMIPSIWPLRPGETNRWW